MPVRPAPMSFQARVPTASRSVRPGPFDGHRPHPRRRARLRRPPTDPHSQSVLPPGSVVTGGTKSSSVNVKKGK